MTTDDQVSPGPMQMSRQTSSATTRPKPTSRTVADVLVEDDGTVVDLEDAAGADIAADEPGDERPPRQPAARRPRRRRCRPTLRRWPGALEVIDAEDLLEEEAEEPEISPYDRPGRWYVVHTQSGYENKVRQNLEARIGSMNMEGRIHEVVIPVEDVVEFKGGRKVVVPRKVFPGYLLVRCQLDDDSWYVIRNTPGVTGFVGQGNKPSPLPRRDVEAFLSVRKTGDQPTKRGRPRLEYELGETVRVKEGPFADFSGEIVDINEDQLKVKVLVNIFGRETPVELEFSQIARL